MAEDTQNPAVPLTALPNSNTNSDAAVAFRKEAETALLFKQLQEKVAIEKAEHEKYRQAMIEEQSKVRAEAAAAQSAANQFVIKTALEKALTDAGLKNKKALDLVKTDGVSFEAGSVKGLDEKVKAFKEEYPELFQVTVGTTGANVTTPNAAAGANSGVPDGRKPLPARIPAKERIRTDIYQNKNQQEYNEQKAAFLRDYRRNHTPRSNH